MREGIHVYISVGCDVWSVGGLAEGWEGPRVSNGGRRSRMCGKCEGQSDGGSCKGYNYHGLCNGGMRGVKGEGCRGGWRGVVEVGGRCGGWRMWKRPEAEVGRGEVFAGSEVCSVA